MIDEVLALLRPGGVLSFAIPGYEAREQQLQMAEDVAKAYNDKEIALIEAGTGTGKSVAYLLPAILNALKNQERTVISTHTINLQEQLLFKDIPFLLKALDLDLKVVLVKGMNNYLCLRKLHDYSAERNTLSQDEVNELDKVIGWSEKTKDGSRSDLPFMPSLNLWQEVSCESDACSHIECPDYKECHFFKARKEAEEANLLIVNHHLLAVDLSSKQESPAGGLLPAYKRVIIDEAHHLEDVATEYFAKRVTKWDLQRIFSRLISDKKLDSRPGRLNQLKQKINEQFPQQDQTIIPILSRIEIDLAGEKQLISHHIQEAFQALTFFFNHISIEKEEEGSERKWRLRKEHLKHPLWKSEVLSKMQALIDALKRYVHALESLEMDIKHLNNERLNEKTKNLRLEIGAFSNRLSKAAQTISRFIEEEHTKETVRWMEIRPMRSFLNMHLVFAELDISKMLEENLFKPLDTVILSSATLATRKTFQFIKKRLGLSEGSKTIVEKIYESPFDFEKQALLVVPKDIEDPSNPKFSKSAAEHVFNAILACKGQAFVLFTSFSMLKSMHAHLEERLAKNQFPTLVQGQDQRKTLLEKFKTTKRAVLFGTDSFWEGVDVVGDALRCVIIVKLPFRVPSEPIIQARSEAIDEDGGDSFLEYTVPTAIVKFKQGFGRLIRNKQDRGCIVCLDKRLLSKGYGKFFLESLPKCSSLFEESKIIHDAMKQFYWSVPGSNR